MIPLCLEADYMPDGWLGQLCAESAPITCCHFDDRKKFDDQFSRLENRLKEIPTTANGCDTGMTIISPEFYTLTAWK